MERLGLIAALASACTFTPGVLAPERDGGADDVPGDGRRVTSDGRTDARDAHTPSWVVVETLTVPANGVQVTSTLALDAGVTYRLRASGTWVIQNNIGNGTRADAEWWNFEDLQDGVIGVDVGLAINDTSNDAIRTPKWGPYNPSHVYEVDWVGDGQPIVAMMHDGNYANNTGSLTLDILAWQ